MKLYVIELNDNGLDMIRGYDFNSKMVIRARDSREARKIASLEANDEGKEVWLDKKYSKCCSLNMFRPKHNVICIEGQNG